MHDEAIRFSEHNNNLIPLLGLSVIFFLILGMLPMIPSPITQMLRPAEVALCLIFPALHYYRITPSGRWMILYMFYYVMVLLFNPVTKTAVMAWASLELFSAFFLLMVSRPWSKANIRALLIVAAIASTIFAVIIFRDNPNFLHEKSYDGTKFMSSTVNDNTAAYSIVPGALCSVLLFLFYAPRKISNLKLLKAFFLVCSAICFFLLFCIGARSAFFSALAGAALIVLEWSNNRRTTGGRVAARIAIILLLVSLFVVGASIATGTHSARLFDLDNMTDGNGRDVLAEQAWEMIHKKPVFGGGFDYWMNENGDPLGTHNAFLTHMVQGGYVAVFILAGFLIVSVYELWKSRSLIPLAFIMEMIAHTFTESDLNYYAYVPLIISFVLVRYAWFNRCRIIDIFANNYNFG